MKIGMLEMVKGFVVKARSLIATWLNWFPPTLTRVSLGLLFIETGWGKIHGFDHVIAYFNQLGIPHPVLTAHVVAYTELIGGSLLLVGLLTRFACIPLMISMTVAILTAKRDDISEFSDLVMMAEYTFIVLFTWLAIHGAGPLSVDNLLRRSIERETSGKEIDDSANRLLFSKGPSIITKKVEP